MADGYVMPAYKFTNTLAIAFFVFVFGTLFISGDTRGSAIAALVWLIVFGGFCQWRQHLEDRDLKTAMNKVNRSRRSRKADAEVSSRK